MKRLMMWLIGLYRWFFPAPKNADAVDGLPADQPETARSPEGDQQGNAREYHSDALDKILETGSEDGLEAAAEQMMAEAAEMEVNSMANSVITQIRAALKMVMNDAQRHAVYLILKECRENGVTDSRQIAYILATCYHECRFNSIAEIRAKPGTQVREWQDKYWPSGYYGRGFCQLTWKRNYQKFSPIVGADLVANPDLVLHPEIGAKILVVGMKRGMFSGFGLDRYFTDKLTDWIGARGIVNGTFQADKVADAAKVILEALK